MENSFDAISFCRIKVMKIWKLNVSVIFQNL